MQDSFLHLALGTTPLDGVRIASRRVLAPVEATTTQLRFIEVQTRRLPPTSPHRVGGREHLAKGSSSVTRSKTQAEKRHRLDWQDPRPITTKTDVNQHHFTYCSPHRRLSTSTTNAPIRSHNDRSRSNCGPPAPRSLPRAKPRRRLSSPILWSVKACPEQRHRESGRRRACPRRSRGRHRNRGWGKTHKRSALSIPLPPAEEGRPPRSVSQGKGLWWARAVVPPKRDVFKLSLKLIDVLHSLRLVFGCRYSRSLLP